MGTISSVNDVTWANLSSFVDVAKANISSILDQDKPASATGITFSNLTTSCSTNINWNTSTIPFVVNLPSGATNGSFVVMFLSHDYIASTDVLADVTGWTKVKGAGDTNSDAWCYILYRVFNGTEGSTVNVYSTGDQTSRDLAARTFIIEGIDTSNPFPVTGSTAIVASAAFIDVPSIAYSYNGRAIAMIAYDGGDGEPFSIGNSYTKYFDGACDESSTGLGFALAYRDFTGSGNTGAVRFTATGSLADGFAGFQLFIKPA